MSKGNEDQINEVISVKIHCTVNQSSASEYCYTEYQGRSREGWVWGELPQLSLSQLLSSPLWSSPSSSTAVWSSHFPHCRTQGVMEHREHLQNRNRRAEFKSQVQPFPGYFLTVLLPTHTPPLCCPLQYECLVRLMFPLFPLPFYLSLLNSFLHLYHLYSHPKLTPRGSHCMAKY